MRIGTEPYLIVAKAWTTSTMPTGPTILSAVRCSDSFAATRSNSRPISGPSTQTLISAAGNQCIPWSMWSQ
jgi:hypothetical protein